SQQLRQKGSRPRNHDHQAGKNRILGFRRNSSRLRTESLPTAVSVARKTGFPGRRKMRQYVARTTYQRSQRPAVVQQARQFGAFLNHYGKFPQPAECVVVVAGMIEPVSSSKFAPNKEINTGFFSSISPKVGLST